MHPALATKQSSIGCTFRYCCHRTIFLARKSIWRLATGAGHFFPEGMMYGRVQECPINHPATHPSPHLVFPLTRFAPFEYANKQIIFSINRNYSHLCYYWLMLHYNWNDLIISAQLLADKILFDAVPSNIRNLPVEPQQGIEHIEKAFQGQITAPSLTNIIPQQHKEYRSIYKFYQYVCECFNTANSGLIEQKIRISREWCFDSANINKRERITINIHLFKQLAQHQRVQCLIRLKEVYLTPNGLLLKCNTIIFNQLDYHKQAYQQYSQRILQLKQSTNARIDKQIAGLKAQINTIIQEMQQMKESKDSKRQKKGKKSHRKQQCKIEEDQTQQPAKQRRKPHSISCDQPKIEQVIKYQEDQQSKRLKILEDSSPQSKIIAFPIKFDQTNPAYHFFSFSNGFVTKIGGFDYPMAILKNIIPKEGTHGAIIKYVIQKKIKRSCCLEIGIVDQDNKALLHSSVSDNYIFFKFNVSTVCTKVKGKEKKKRFGRLRPLVPGQSVQIRVNLGLGIISWTASYGQTVRAQIPQQLRKMNLQPFVAIFTTGDMVEFQEYPVA